MSSLVTAAVIALVLAPLVLLAADLLVPSRRAKRRASPDTPAPAAATPKPAADVAANAAAVDSRHPRLGPVPASRQAPAVTTPTSEGEQERYARELAAHVRTRHQQRRVA